MVEDKLNPDKLLKELQKDILPLLSKILKKEVTVDDIKNSKSSGRKIMLYLYAKISQLTRENKELKEKLKATKPL